MDLREVGLGAWTGLIWLRIRAVGGRLVNVLMKLWVL
jgi:hypothetical protein